MSTNESATVDHPWFITNKYAAIVSLGALVSGWSLISPIAHSNNLSTNFNDPSFWSFAAKAEEIIRSRYGKVSIFEHGAQHTGSNTGCGTDHAHLHMVPLDFSLSQEAVRFDPNLSWKPCSVLDIVNLVGENEYLFVSDDFQGQATTGLLCILEVPISQFFRRVIATRKGMRDLYDYRKFPMLEIAENSAIQLRIDSTSPTT